MSNPYESPQSPTGSSVPPPGFNKSEVNQKKTLAGILGILFGAFGVHKFILGYTTPAVITLSVSLACMVLGCCGGMLLLIPYVLLLGYFAFAVIGLVEGIIYLTKSDEEFYNTYILGRREWF